MASLLSPYAVLMSVVNVTITFHWYLIRQSRLPPRLQQVYQYGKTLKPINIPESGGLTDLVFNLVTTTVPKAYFRFFYPTAVIVNAACFLMPHYVLVPIQIIFERGDIIFSRHPLYLMILGLESLQIMRRCYECFFVSVYSPPARINMSQMILGFGFYAGVALIITNFGFLDNGMDAQPVSFVAILFGLALFASGFVLQFETHRTLAGLRRRMRPDGKLLIVTYDHMIPHGHLFELVSNPHYFAEILIYAAFVIMSQFDLTFQLLFYYVLITHCVMSEQSHRWYQEKFKELYPKRSILIPGVY